MKITGALKFSIEKLVLYLFFILLTSCRYGLPDDKYFNDIQKNTPNAVISLTDYNNNDTIFIYQPTQFQFSITAPVNISKVEVLIGSTTLESFNSASGSFYLSYNNWITGTSTLKIQFTSNAGTGSLADHLGTETITLWRSWVFIVDPNPPPAPTLTVSTVNGFLKLRWTPFKKPSFIEYIVYPGHNTKSGGPILINDPNVTSYVDSSYVDGSNTYRVTIVAATGESDSYLTVNNTQSASYTYHAPDSTVTLVWKKPPYMSAVKNIVVTENGNVINTITPSSDTTYSFHLTTAAFGSSSTAGLTINASYPYSGYAPFTFIASIDNPTNSQHIVAVHPYLINLQSYYYSEPLDAIVASNQKDGYVRVYNSAMKVVDSMTTSLTLSLFSVPYPGQYAYYAVDRNVVQKNLVDGTTRTYYASEGAYGSLVTSVSGASNGFVKYTVYDPKNNFGYASLININTGTFITSSFYPLLSDDGRYSLSGPVFDSYDGSQFSFTQYEPINDGKFRPDNTDELISAATPTLIVKGADGTLLRTIGPPDNSYTWRSYDPVTHMLLYTKTGSLKSCLVNIDDNSLKTINGTGIAFINGILFDSNGNYIKLM